MQLQSSHLHRYVKNIVCKGLGLPMLQERVGSLLSRLISGSAGKRVLPLKQGEHDLSCIFQSKGFDHYARTITCEASPMTFVCVRESLCHVGDEPHRAKSHLEVTQMLKL